MCGMILNAAAAFYIRNDTFFRTGARSVDRAGRQQLQKKKKRKKRKRKEKREHSNSTRRISSFFPPTGRKLRNIRVLQDVRSFLFYTLARRPFRRFEEISPAKLRNPKFLVGDLFNRLSAFDYFDLHRFKKLNLDRC